MIRCLPCRPRDGGNHEPWHPRKLRRFELGSVRAAEGFARQGTVLGGRNHSLALRSDGTVWAWGDNTQGQLGVSAPAFSRTPPQVPGLFGITAIDGGDGHTLALKTGGTVWSFGANDTGQLGDGSLGVRRTSPVQVQGLFGMVSISAGAQHSLAVKSDGVVWGWGDNSQGALGNGMSSIRLRPVRVF